MKLKKLVQALAIGCGILSLAACTHHNHQTDPASVNDLMNGGNGGGAQASGVAGGSNWGDDSAGQGGQGLQKRIYYFDYDKSDVHPQDRSSILANANYIMHHPHARVVVEGHTDPRGSREYNIALGERRAEAVASLLRSRGVGSNQIRVVSYGAERLAVPGRTENDYRLDRRAVIVYRQK